MKDHLGSAALAFLMVSAPLHESGRPNASELARLAGVLDAGVPR